MLTGAEKVQWAAERQQQQLREQANDYQMCQQMITEVHLFASRSYEMMGEEISQIQQEFVGTPHEAMVKQVGCRMVNIFARHCLRLNELVYHQLIMNLNREQIPRTPAECGQAQPSFFDQLFKEDGEP